MRKKHKLLIACLCSILLCTASVLGTLAYLTDQDEVKNTFTAGHIGITLDETKVNPDGTPIPNQDPVKSNDYTLVPGQSYTKDPKITIDPDSEESWLFVKVLNGIEKFEASGTTSIAAQMAANGWTLLAGESNVFVYKDKVDGTTPPVPVFASFTLATDADITSTSVTPDTTVTVTAYAIQAAGLNTAQEAWNALNP